MRSKIGTGAVALVLAVTVTTACAQSKPEKRVGLRGIEWVIFGADRTRNPHIT